MNSTDGFRTTGLLRDLVPADNYEVLRGDFERDAQLRAMRVADLTRPLFEDLSRRDLADALLVSAEGDQGRVDLAGQIAGIEFERLVTRIARRGGLSEEATL